MDRTLGAMRHVTAAEAMLITTVHTDLGPNNQDTGLSVVIILRGLVLNPWKEMKVIKTCGSFIYLYGVVILQLVSTCQI